MSKMFALSAHDAVPGARAGGPGPLRSLVSGVLEALSTAREAEAEYKRQVSRGVDPSDAVRAAFHSYER